MNIFIIRDMKYFEESYNQYVADWYMVTHPTATQEDFEDLCNQIARNGTRTQSAWEIANGLTSHGFTIVHNYNA